MIRKAPVLILFVVLAPACSKEHPTQVERRALLSLQWRTDKSVAFF